GRHSRGGDDQPDGAGSDPSLDESQRLHGRGRRRSHRRGLPLSVLDRGGPGHGPANWHSYGQRDCAAAGNGFSAVRRHKFGAATDQSPVARVEFRGYRPKRKLRPARTTLLVSLTSANAGPNPATCGVKATWRVPKS